MATEMNDIDDFLAHKSSDRGGGFLKGWKKKGSFINWMHMQRKPVALWRHGLPNVVTREVEGEQVVNVWGGNFNCYEDESVLKKQWRRNDDGKRELPPLYCPLCRTIECVYQLVLAGKIPWTKALFKFEGDDPKETSVLHAGGLWNAFGKKDMEPEQKAQMKAAGIFARDAWKENIQAKLSYLFCVVDDSNVSQGVQIATETSLLGDKVKEVINAARKSLGKDAGNPFLHPFAIEWEYFDAEQQFNKKYAATRLEKQVLTPAIAKLIRTNPPDLTNVLKPFDKENMRAYLEEHCLIKGMPWDDIFDVQTKEEDSEEGGEESGVQESEEEELDLSKETKPAAKTSSAKPSTKKSEPEPDDMVACDDCDAPMKETDPKCKKCGKVYMEEEKVAPTPPPPMRKRGAAAQAAAKAPKAPPPPKSSTKDLGGGGADFGQEEDDGIPFVVDATTRGHWSKP